MSALVNIVPHGQAYVGATCLSVSRWPSMSPLVFVQRPHSRRKCMPLGPSVTVKEGDSVAILTEPMRISTGTWAVAEIGKSLWYGAAAAELKELGCMSWYDLMMSTTCPMLGRSRLSCAQHWCINFHASSLRGGLSSRGGRTPVVRASIIGRSPNPSKGIAP